MAEYQDAPQITAAARAKGATLARAIAATAGVACAFSVVAAAVFPPDDLTTGTFAMSALVMATTSVASLGMVVRSSRAAVQLLLLLNLICVAGIVAIAAGYVICVIGLIYGAVIAFVISGSEWWPGVALDPSVEVARLAPENSLTRISTAMAAGVYVWLGLLVLAFTLQLPAPIGIASLFAAGVFLLLFMRKLGNHIIAVKVESQNNGQPG